MKAKEFLNQVKKWDTIIENKMIERQQWKDIAMSTTAQGTNITINGIIQSMERVQSTANPQKMADAINRYVDIEKEINQCIDALVDAKKEVVGVIEQLATTEYDILHKVYVQHLTLYDVADKYNKTYSWVTTVHGRALKNVQNILNERG